MALMQRRPVTSWGNRTIIAGSFGPNGVADPTDVRGLGYTVARTGAGINTVTFTSATKRAIALVATLELAAAADVRVILSNVAISAAGILSFDVVTTKSSDGVTAVDIAGAAGNMIHFLDAACVLGSSV